MPPERSKNVRRRMKPYEHSVEEDQAYPPEKYRTYFACPFVKHDSNRYENVNNACTQRWGFENIGRLNEHILRAHSQQFGCNKCKKRFTQATKTTIEQVKASHACRYREQSFEDPEWMSEEQESRLATWSEECKGQEAGSDKWTRIYKCLFEEGNDEPSPFYDFLIPQHLRSTPASHGHGTQVNEQDDLQHMDPLLIDHPRYTYENTSISTDAHTYVEHSLGQALLQENEKQFDYGFDFSVYRGTDSGYHSGARFSEQQLPDNLLENEPAISHHAAEQTADARDAGQSDLLIIGQQFSTLSEEEEDVKGQCHYGGYFEEAMRGKSPCLDDYEV